MTLELSIATGILIAAAIITVVALAVNKTMNWCDARLYKKEREEEKAKEKSPMVKRFQYLAGITNSYEGNDGYLRSRFNRIRSTAYSGDYNYRFNRNY